MGDETRTGAAIDGRWDYADGYAWMERVVSMPPVIITAAVNGGVQGSESHPRLPETAEQIAAAAYEAYCAGAAVVHVHPRNPKNFAECATDPEAFREVNSLVRDKCRDIIINNSTGISHIATMEDRLRVLESRPEMASLNAGPDMSRFTLSARLSPLPYPRESEEKDICIPFTYGFIEKLAAKMKALNIKPEIELYHSGHYWVSRSLSEQKILEPPPYFQFVMGYQTSAFPTPRNLLNLVDELPSDSVFSVIGIGKFQWPMVTMGLVLGGNVRVGLEDNLYLKRGQKLEGNGEAVEKVVRIAKELNRDIATPAEARAILGISAVPTRY